MAGRQRSSSETSGVRIGYAIDSCGASEDCSVMWVSKERRTGQGGTNVVGMDVVRRCLKNGVVPRRVEWSEVAAEARLLS